MQVPPSPSPSPTLTFHHPQASMTRWINKYKVVFDQTIKKNCPITKLKDVGNLKEQFYIPLVPLQYLWNTIFTFQFPPNIHLYTVKCHQPSVYCTCSIKIKENFWTADKYLQNQPPLVTLVSSAGVFSFLMKFFKRTLTRSFALELLYVIENITCSHGCLT